MQLIIEYHGPREGQAYEDWKREEWGNIRAFRQKLVTETDWTQMSDAPLTAEQVEAFKTYRQALRDIPQSYSDPDSVVWPEKPTI